MDNHEIWLFNDSTAVIDRERAIQDEEEENAARASQCCMDIAAETSAIPARESRILEAAGTSKAPSKNLMTILAPDVSWNMPFKQHIQREYNNWMMAADREWTEIVQNVWHHEQSRLFRGPLIHCLRPEGSIPLGQELLRKARLEKDVEVIIPEEPDEDEDVNNAYKSEDNIAQ
ncbi:hypothetical protein DdX_19604 [Ditylenchus destructor]|uniref:Uncharacterized protein n=1 Tax=Ditylenchus destructor TaxID=166010 RepID=A0AAD4QX95_9BILA|nr:hypothetical protein DdX_19604 [Ditylenchus destructor]